MASSAAHMVCSQTTFCLVASKEVMRRNMESWGLHLCRRGRARSKQGADTGNCADGLSQFTGLPIARAKQSSSTGHRTTARGGFVKETSGLASEPAIAVDRVYCQDSGETVLNAREQQGQGVSFAVTAHGRGLRLVGGGCCATSVGTATVAAALSFNALHFSCDLANRGAWLY